MSKSATPALPIAQLNDILVHYRKKITITNDGSNTDIYLRALSAPNLTDQENHALIASHLERKALRDASSITYMANIEPIHDLDDEDLDTRIAFQYMQVAWIEVWVEMPTLERAIPKDQEDYTDDPLEKREQALLKPLNDEEQRQSSFEKARSLLHQEKMRTKKEWLSLSSREDKIKEAVRLTIQERANTAYNKAARSALAALCAYSDPLCTQRLWEVKTAHLIPQSLVDVIAQEYSEVGATNLLPFSERL